MEISKGEVGMQEIGPDVWAALLRCTTSGISIGVELNSLVKEQEKLSLPG
jgi:hypothetical protein